MSASTFGLAIATLRRTAQIAGQAQHADFIETRGQAREFLATGGKRPRTTSGREPGRRGADDASEREALEQVADVRPGVARRSRWPAGCAGRRRLVVPAGGRRRIESMVEGAERGQTEDTLDELEDRGQVVRGRL